MDWDLFISHASEDKDDVARPLADQFIELGLKVWYDEYTLTVGDSLRRSIDRGLASCRFGLVILSPHFLEKEWTQKELDGLVAREDGTAKRILPVWHNVSRSDIVAFSPTLADRLGVSTAKGLNHVVKQIMRVFQIDAGKAHVKSPKKKQRSQQKQRIASSKGEKKVGSTGTWVMLDQFFFRAQTVKHGQDGLFTIEIAPSNAEQEADLQTLLPRQHGGSRVPFAVRNDAHLVRIKGCEKDISGEPPVWKLTLAPEENGFGGNGVPNINDGGKTDTPDDIARLRAGRILVNDPPLKAPDKRGYDSWSLVETYITGATTGYPVKECAIQSIFAKYAKNSSWRELARLQAVFLLKASGTVEHILDLTIGPVRGGKVAVTFRGRRRPEYSSESTVIEISNSCPLK
jgi:TIR domain-containing protein